jgi:hypothetical protein
MIRLLVVVGLFAGLARLPAASDHNAQVDVGAGHHKCKLPNGNDFPGRDPGGHCPPDLTKHRD